MTRIRVSLAEDHTIVRKGIRSLLDDEPGIEVVGEADNGRDAVAQAQTLVPDIVVMDHTMPLLNGLEAMRQIRQRLAFVDMVQLQVLSWLRQPVESDNLDDRVVSQDVVH